jgi:hypothetical protein
MQHIARFKLMPRRFQDLRACNIRASLQKRHCILKLVAETERPTRLIQRGASPHAASERLIQHPTIEHQIHAGIRSFNRDGIEDLIPLMLDGLPNRLNLRR